IAGPLQRRPAEERLHAELVASHVPAVVARRLLEPNLVGEDDPLGTEHLPVAHLDGDERLSHSCHYLPFTFLSASSIMCSYSGTQVGSVFCAPSLRYGCGSMPWAGHPQ